jgi:hypothetical protein
MNDIRGMTYTVWSDLGGLKNRQSSEPSEKERDMTSNIRFHCDFDFRVVDVLNPARGTEGRFDFTLPGDDMHLREEILRVRLGELVDNLLGNPRGKRCDGEPTANVRGYVLIVIESIVNASHLKTLDPSISIEHRFGGDLGQPRDGVEPMTSLALFRVDLERLLLDLYGDVHRDALGRVVEAVETIVSLFCSDLQAENEFAQSVDVTLRDNPHIFDGLTEDEVGYGLEQYPALRAHAREVLENPAEFAPYTVEFAKRFSQRFPLYNEPISGRWRLSPSIGLSK